MTQADDESRQVPSPCISVCTINQATAYCKGCYRTSEEIAAWPFLNNSQKRTLINTLQQRKKSDRINT
jgi:uncharacterized protein